ncbi:hypothetical protein M422DRAFT_253252 [Sphaerobolus stellatus SS14]|uniref:Unplaced genomic scaffold SPHSTscaffold_48, whole genome shotgun sequence n=1 Tax=Sphaerobolus stellatus (strain SS14) TaxID=990650 RepID=A0A0C9UK26_SPHS4|nr:hypothetical protein M422DRAFT_253252 [Sphaerobolus stellatus SS14]
MAFAGPMSLHMVRDCDALCGSLSSLYFGWGAYDEIACALGLGPTGAGCISAAVEVGANPIADASCVAGALKTAVSPPASCSGCGGGLVDDVEGAFDDVKNGIEGLF